MKAFALSLVFFASYSAFANPCASYIKKFCADVAKGGGQVMTCLKEHESELGVECKTSLSAHEDLHEDAKTLRAENKNEIRELRKELRAACKDDVKSKCLDVAPGEARILKCLQENEATLAAPCRAELTKVSALKEENKKEFQALQNKRPGVLQGKNLPAHP